MKSSADEQEAAHRSTVRERVLAIIAHNTSWPQPPAAQVTSVVLMAAQVGLNPATVQSVLDELAAEGEIERHTTTNGETRVALAGNR